MAGHYYNNVSVRMIRTVTMVLCVETKGGFKRLSVKRN